MPFYCRNLTEWADVLFQEELDAHVADDSLEDLYTFVNSLDDESDFADHISEIFTELYSIPQPLLSAMLNSIDWDVVRSEFRNYCDHNDRVVEAQQHHAAVEAFENGMAALKRYETAVSALEVAVNKIQ
jgi:hypothetical protein